MDEQAVTELRTARTLLRAWRDEDLEPFARLNADPEVMRWFPSPLSTEASDALAARIRARLAEEGWGLWALEVPGVSPFCGFVGLSRVPFEASFTPAVEIGWRLDQPWWGHGYATEAATAVVEFRVRDTRAVRDRLVHYDLEHEITCGHGTPRPAARSSW